MKPCPVAVLKVTRQELSSPFAAIAHVIGSGFFVAPGVIATCNHVIDDAVGRNRPSSNPSIVAIRGGEAYRFQRTDTIADEARDLGLIRLKHDVPADDIFELATEPPQQGLQCVVQGYAQPMSAIQGCAGRGLDLEKRWYFDISAAALQFPGKVIEVRRGFQADGPLVLPDATVICCEGEVKQGLSGGPLIDVDSGRVVGVQAMGPQALPPWESSDGRGLGNWTVAIATKHLQELLESSELA